MNHPALNHAVIHLKIALHYNLFEITIAQRLRQVPTGALEYHLLSKVSSIEIDHTVAQPVHKVAFIVPLSLVRCCL